MPTISDISKDIVIRFKNDLFLVVDFQHVNPGKGSAFVRARLKNIRSGKVVEYTFKAGEEIEVVEVERRKLQYLYADAEGFHFMDPKSYDQVTISAETIGDKAKFLFEGQEAVVLFLDVTPLTIDIPRKVTLAVVEAAPGVRGDTASGNVTKEAMLENGLKIRVPMFIKEGERVIVNTDTGEYVERA